MRLGLQVPAFTWPGGPAELGATLARIAVDAEDAGVDSLWVMDHYFQLPMVGPPQMEMLESYTTLAYVAGVTKRITLGAMVTGVTYRHPGILVKTVTTLDVLSGGRAWLGIGAAWNEEEHRGLGVPFPPMKERFERLEETLRIATQMWAGDESPFAGKHYHLERPINSPQALQRPHPPILVGGMGEQKTLRFVARYADACNLFEGADLGHKLDVLRDHCAAEGRDYGSITRSTLGSLQLTEDGADGTSTVAQAVDRFGRLADQGIDMAIVYMGNVTDPHVFERMAEVVDQVAGIAPTGR